MASDFPFRDAPTSINRFLIDIDKLLWKVSRDICPRLPAEVRDELVQSARIHLASYALPKFDASRKIKPTTFAYLVIRRHMLGELNRLQRERRASRCCRRLDSDTAAIDFTNDRQIELLAERVMADPVAAGLTESETTAFNALLAAEPGELLQDISSRLGYSRSTSLSRTLRSIRDKLRELDPAEPKEPQRKAA